MTIAWTMTSEANTSQGVKVLTWAESGLGKTTLCATAPRPAIISAESGLLSLRKSNLERIYGVDTPGIAYDIPVLQVKTLAEFDEAYQFFSTSQHAAVFDTICIDSISEIGEVVLNQKKASVKDPRMAYGEMIEKMETMIRKFRDLQGKHVYMTAKSEWAKDEVTGVTKYGPSMPGNKLGQKLPYFFDEVFQLAINKTQAGVPYRYLRTQPDIQNIAKDRSGALDAIEEPHLGKIFSKILQGV